MKADERKDVEEGMMMMTVWINVEVSVYAGLLDCVLRRKTKKGKKGRKSRFLCPTSRVSYLVSLG